MSERDLDLADGRVASGGAGCLVDERSQLILDLCRITGCMAESGNSGGAAVFADNLSALTLRRTSVTDNRTNGAGAIGAFLSVVMIEASTVARNSAARAPAVNAQASILTMSNTTISDNQTDPGGDPGAVFVSPEPGLGLERIEVVHCTIIDPELLSERWESSSTAKSRTRFSARPCRIQPIRVSLSLTSVMSSDKPRTSSLRSPNMSA